MLKNVVDKVLVELRTGERNKKNSEKAVIDVLSILSGKKESGRYMECEEDLVYKSFNRPSVKYATKGEKYLIIAEYDGSISFVADNGFKRTLSTDANETDFYGYWFKKLD